MLKLEARPQPSGFWRIASPLLALVLTVVIGVVLFLALGKDPVQGLRVFFWEPIRSSYALGELVVKATPLLIIALGLALCFRSNVWNIGAEGQYVMGAVFATGIALMADNLNALPFAVGLSRRTRRVIRQNLLASLGVVAILIPATILRAGHRSGRAHSRGLNTGGGGQRAAPAALSAA